MCPKKERDEPSLIKQREGKKRRRNRTGSGGKSALMSF